MKDKEKEPGAGVGSYAVTLRATGTNPMFWWILGIILVGAMVVGFVKLSPAPTAEDPIKQVLTERKYQPIIFKGKNEGNARSIGVSPKDPSKREELNGLVAAHRILDTAEKESPEDLVRLMIIRRSILDLLPEKDVQVITELRILCDSWQLQIGIATPVFEFHGCGKYASDLRD